MFAILMQQIIIMLGCIILPDKFVKNTHGLAFTYGCLYIWWFYRLINYPNVLINTFINLINNFHIVHFVSKMLVFNLLLFIFRPISM